jgi:hypothetical protein
MGSLQIWRVWAYEDSVILWVNGQRRGTRWRVWLWHCATTRKVAASIIDGVAVALGSTQPVTVMSTTNIFLGAEVVNIRADKLTPSCADYLEIWEP